MASHKKDEQEPFLAGLDSGLDNVCKFENVASRRNNMHKAHSVILLLNIAVLALNVSLLIFNTFHAQRETKIEFAHEQVDEPYCE